MRNVVYALASVFPQSWPSFSASAASISSSQRSLVVVGHLLGFSSPPSLLSFPRFLSLSLSFSCCCSFHLQNLRERLLSIQSFVRLGFVIFDILSIFTCFSWIFRFFCSISFHCLSWLPFDSVNIVFVSRNLLPFYCDLRPTRRDRFLMILLPCGPISKELVLVEPTVTLFLSLVAYRTLSVETDSLDSFHRFFVAFTWFCALHSRWPGTTQAAHFPSTFLHYLTCIRPMCLLSLAVFSFFF